MRRNALSVITYSIMRREDASLNLYSCINYIVGVGTVMGYNIYNFPLSCDPNHTS